MILRRGLRVAVIACASISAACYHWVERDPDPQAALQQLAATTHQSVRLTLTEGGRLELQRPLILADSIVQRPQYPDMRSVATARTSISKVETRRFSLGRTSLAVGLSVLAYPVLYVLYYLTCGCYDM